MAVVAPAVTALFVLAAGAAPGLAQAPSRDLPRTSGPHPYFNDLPCDPSSETTYEMRRFNRKVDPGYRVPVMFGDSQLRIPVAYLDASTPPNLANCPLKPNLIGFEFWMPDLRAPQQSVVGRGTAFRPKEVGRPPLGPRDYVVLVREARYVGPNGLTMERVPAVGIKNVLEGYRGAFKLVDEFGLKKIVSPPKRNIYGEWARHDFWIRQTSEEDALVDCIFPQGPAPGGCTAYVMFHDLQIYVYLQGPTNIVEDMMEVFKGIRTLMARWRE
ncbi:MAG: hypothetical protein BGP06_06180 [Rhizobiales bacterium 65-9]|nr:MAG: hypothetical protein BGP06_06180 [Rhizobiales bacterium 65-9]